MIKKYMTFENIPNTVLRPTSAYAGRSHWPGSAVTSCLMLAGQDGDRRSPQGPSRHVGLLPRRPASATKISHQGLQVRER